MVEADETIIRFRTKNDPVVVPAGRSGVGKMLVAGAVEIDGSKPRRARLKVIEGFGKPELHAFVLDAVAPQTQLITDDWPSYRDLPGVRHNAITLGPMAAHIVLPWIHRLFSNLKRWGLGVYHGHSAGLSLAQSLTDDLSAAPLRLCADADADANASAGNSRHRRFLDLDTTIARLATRRRGFPISLSVRPRMLCAGVGCESPANSPHRSRPPVKMIRPALESCGEVQNLLLGARELTHRW